MCINIYIYICRIYKMAILQKGRVLCFYGVCFFMGVTPQHLFLQAGGGVASLPLQRETPDSSAPRLWVGACGLGTLEQISALFSSRFATSSTTTTVEDKGNGGIYIFVLESYMIFLIIFYFLNVWTARSQTFTSTRRVTLS